MASRRDRPTCTAPLPVEFVRSSGADLGQLGRKHCQVVRQWVLHSMGSQHGLQRLLHGLLRMEPQRPLGGVRIIRQSRQGVGIVAGLRRAFSNRRFI
jgi:hypothetical protein